MFITADGYFYNGRSINMKKVELAVRNVIHGQPMTNRDALANPDCLRQYEKLDELKQKKQLSMMFSASGNVGYDLTEPSIPDDSGVTVFADRR